MDNLTSGEKTNILYDLVSSPSDLTKVKYVIDKYIACMFKLENKINRDLCREEEEINTNVDVKTEENSSERSLMLESSKMDGSTEGNDFDNGNRRVSRIYRWEFLVFFFDAVILQ